MTLFDTQPASTTQENANLGVIGSRQLIAVQTFDIARLTSHPVAVIPSSFVAVTGRGPRDSNESGKTSFNAAVALLLGDPEWRIGGGGVAAVAELLFEPDTAGVAATRYPAAQTGFIVGVFADPDDVEETAHSVWMKLSSQPKYVQVRHNPGVHLVSGETDPERHRLAPAVWASLPAATELGAHTYVDTLYGRSPRCLAYVAARGKQRSGPSLLKMDTGAFRPEDIGGALVRLTGRSDALETEQEQRRKLADETQSFDQATEEHGRKWSDEEAVLHGVHMRRSIRELLTDGQHLWRQHLARGLLDTHTRYDMLGQAEADARATVEELKSHLHTKKVEEAALSDDQGLADKAAEESKNFDTADRRLTEARDAETRLTTKAGSIREQLGKLEELGARQAKLDVDTATEIAETRRSEHTEAAATVLIAQQAIAQLKTNLENARLGRIGPAGLSLELLENADVEAIGLLDSLEVSATHRDLWEPRLHPWRDAICVATTSRDDALAALTSQPGAIVISGSQDSADEPLPPGIVAAPPSAISFLAQLDQHSSLTESLDVIAVNDPVLGVDIVGGFAQPTTGRAQLIAGLEEHLNTARGEFRAAEQRAELAERRERQALTDLDAARAAAEYRALSAVLRAIETIELPAAREQVELRDQERETALADHTKAQAELLGLEAARTRARQQREAVEKDLGEAKIAAGKARTARDAVDLAYWVAEFGGTDREARKLLNWAEEPLELDTNLTTVRPPNPRDPEQPPERRHRDTLRNRANERLTEIITVLEINRGTGDGAPTHDIADAVRRRESLADSVGTRLGRDEIGFTALASALEDWLLQLGERDELAEEQITTARNQRASELSFAEARLASLSNGLINIQDSLEQRIESNLTAISEALDRLNRVEGFGACLQWEVIRPVNPDDTWTWKVTPMWRRSPGGRMLPYNNATNSAQEKLFSVHLVLAALLASPNPRGRVLILDELGDSLGEEHRRDVLTAVSQVAQQHGITVLGTCQDAVMPDAASYCGEILYFCYPSKAEALNLPTRMFGFDDNRKRVELTYDALITGRPWT